MTERQYKTAQEKFWAGDFGEEYIGRNDEPKWIASRTSMFASLLRSAGPVSSVLELGANVGQNLQALHNLLPDASYMGVEINPQAADVLRESGWIRVHEGSLLEGGHTFSADLAFTSGVLIHIDPDSLVRAYDALYKGSRKYIAVIEYYNPVPAALPYRGHEDRLFKRDFAGEMMDLYPDLALRDYGFVYRRDPKFPLDDVTWFLMEKTGQSAG